MSPDKPTLDDLRIARPESPRHQSSRWLIVVVIVLLLAGGGVAWWMNRPKTMAVRTVAVKEPSGGSSGQKTLLNASGYVTARRLSTVSSKVSGKVMEVLVEEGMKVEAGQILARLDSSNAEKSLALAEAQLESARKALDETKANLDRAERDVRRSTQLAADKLVTPSELDRVEAEAKSLKARLAKQTADISVAEHEVAVWKQQRDDTVIRAPFAGVVTSKNAQPGEMISPMSAGGFTRTGICTIVDMSSLEIEVDISESYINRVESGRPVEATLDSYPEWKIPAKVIAIIPTADRQKATVKVRVAFEKLDPRILPDMGVKVAFQSGTPGAPEKTPAAQSVVVPKAAVRQIDGRDVVWVVQEGRLERRAVTVGAQQGDEVSITAGLSGGDRVVVGGPNNLAENTRVTETKR
jgi:RND family efflux transporter MFP subunit